MNPTQIESAITSVILAAGGFLIGRGWATASEVSAFATAINSVVGAALVIVPFVRKIYNSSSIAKIQQVNSENNGVKVVPVSAPTAEVNAPIPSLVVKK